MTTATTDLSVVMPCLNEEDSVAECVRWALEGIAKTGLDGEVIVCDNGSTDRSVELAEAAGARVVHQPARGYGNAYLKGFASSHGRYIVMGDSDLTYDFRRLDELVAPLVDGRADYVLGSRFAGQIKRGAMTFSHRYIGNPVLTRILNVFFGLRSTDAHSGLRAFTREAFERMDLRCEGMEFASEIVIKAGQGRLRVSEVPIEYHPRVGETKLPHVPRRVAPPALHAAPRPELALPLPGRPAVRARDDGPVDPPLGDREGGRPRAQCALQRSPVDARPARIPSHGLRRLRARMGRLLRPRGTDPHDAVGA